MKQSVKNKVKTKSAVSSNISLARVNEFDNEIYQKIYRAIIEQRIIAGTKLGEEALCATFNASRSRIRKILLTLSNRNVVELRPHKGAFVATPDPQEARHVFEARRSIEGTIVSRVVERISSDEIELLRKIIIEENEHIKGGNRHDAIRLSGDFHLCLAKISGNHVLHRFLEELVSRTSLIIGMFGTTNNFACAEGEHSKILDAIIAKKSTKTLKIMEEHLHAIEVSIQLPEDEKTEVDFQKLFANM